MLEVTYGGVVLDVSAKGVWFDYGELRAILGRTMTKENLQQQPLERIRISIVIHIY